MADVEPVGRVVDRRGDIIGSFTRITHGEFLQLFISIAVSIPILAKNSKTAVRICKIPALFRCGRSVRRWDERGAIRNREPWKSGSPGMPMPVSYAVWRNRKITRLVSNEADNFLLHCQIFIQNRKLLKNIRCYLIKNK